MSLKKSSNVIKKKIAIYGGAFDPITNGHLHCISEIIHSQIVDEVWVVPSGPRNDKPSMKTSPLHRMIMVHLAVNTFFTSNFPVKVLDIETNKKKSMATYDLLCKLRDKYKNCDFTFVVGSDWLQQANDLRKWESKDPKDPKGEKTIITGNKLINEFDFLVLWRPGYEINNLKSFGPRFKMLTLPYNMEYVDVKVSSTELRKRMCGSEKVREMVHKNLSLVDGLMPPAVLSFIIRNNLYQ